MTEGVVFDLGYQPHDGPRLGRTAAVRALIRDGLRRVLGLRRRARSKFLPWALLAIAVLPALFFVAIGVVIGELDAAATLFGHPEYFDLTGAISLIFIALAASELTVPDRRNGTMSIYASRPLTINDYLFGRFASLAGVVFFFLYVPHIVLWIGRSWVSDDGFASHAFDTLDVLWETGAASLVYIAAFAPLAFLVGTFSDRIAVAAGSIMGVITLSGPASAALVDQGGIDVAGLLAFQHHPGYVKDWLMSANTHNWIPERADFEPIVSLLVIAVVAIGAAITIRMRYRSLR